MELRFRGPLWHWRGPSPFHFVTVPSAEAEAVADLAPTVTSGWGMGPVTVAIGRTSATTSLWPKDGGYIVPVKAALRAAEGLEVGDEVEVTLTV